MSPSTSIQIWHLEQGATVQASYSSKKKTYYFAVFGLAGRGGHPRGYLIRQSNAKVYEGKCLKRAAGKNDTTGTHWGLVFSGLPSAAQPEEYHLVVSEDDDHIAQKLSVAIRFRIKTPPAPKANPNKPPKRNGDGVVIQAPTAGSVICSGQFTACGTYANPLSLTGTMVNDENSIDSGPVSIPENGSDVWYLPFTNVPDGENYTLTVTSSDGGNPSHSQQNLSASANACIIQIPGTPIPLSPPPTPPPPSNGNGGNS